MTRTLIAGFGNVLRGDDGFGVEVLRRLAARGTASASVDLLDVGTGGIRLAQQLLTPYDRLIIVDATTRGGQPGSVYVLAVEDVRPTREIDMHTAVPSRALEVARAMGRLPGEIFLVGCEPSSVDDLTTELTPRVAAAVPLAVARIEELLARAMIPGGGGAAAERPAGETGGETGGGTGAGQSGPRESIAGEASAGASIAREDELLELLYWFEGEGFDGVADLHGIVRFTAMAEPLVARTLARLIARGYIHLGDGSHTGQYRLTEAGRREAARRFAAEFAPLLSQGHGECNDPACDCHAGGEGASECHARGHARAR